MAQKSLTKRQRLLLDAFKEAGQPMTALAIWTKVGQDKMGIATVYRGITRLTETGHVESVEINGAPPMWEVTTRGHHHHFYCTNCQEIYELEGCAGNLQKLLPKGFKLTNHKITLYGSCANCGVH